LKKIHDEKSIKLENIWNFDEHGTAMGASTNTTVLAETARVNRGSTHVKIAENREWVSIIETISVIGRHIFPAVIFKATTQNLQTTWFPHDILQLSGDMTN
jgi:hypothetical protein